MQKASPKAMTANLNDIALGDAPQPACTTAFTTASAQWKPAGDNLKTEWGENLDPNNVLPEYPRPIMEREKWQNLNGLWNYAITDINAAEPSSFDGEILVTFAIESALSGVQKPLTEKQLLSADVNEDTVIDIHDVIMLNQWLLVADM